MPSGEGGNHPIWKRWSDNGVFARIMVGLAAEGADPKTIIIDATYLKAHRAACNLRAKKGGGEALQDKGIRACIPGRKQRKTPIKYDKRRSHIEIMLGTLKNWRRVATRYDRYPKVFLSAIALPAPVIYWL